MKLNRDSIEWAIDFVVRHSDGDIFPSIPEIEAVGSDPDELIDVLSRRDVMGFKPQPHRSFFVPKDDYSYRQSTQLHPQDSILLSAIVYEYGECIEKRRPSKDTVFSYRFNPLPGHGLYGKDSLWNQFWSKASETSKAYTHILYCDIADFYNQIYHHVVENQLNESGLPPDVVKWIGELFKATTSRVSSGIPVGPHGAHLIAECTMIPIDNSLRAKGVHFLRYVDDFFIFCKSEREARKFSLTLATTLDNQQQLILQQ